MPHEPTPPQQTRAPRNALQRATRNIKSMVGKLNIVGKIKADRQREESLDQALKLARERAQEQAIQTRRRRIAQRRAELLDPRHGTNQERERKQLALQTLESEQKRAVEWRDKERKIDEDQARQRALKHSNKRMREYKEDAEQIQALLDGTPTSWGITAERVPESELPSLVPGIALRKLESHLKAADGQPSPSNRSGAGDGQKSGALSIARAAAIAPRGMNMSKRETEGKSARLPLPGHKPYREYRAQVSGQRPGGRGQ